MSPEWQDFYDRLMARADRRMASSTIRPERQCVEVTVEELRCLVERARDLERLIADAAPYSD